MAGILSCSKLNYYAEEQHVFLCENIIGLYPMHVNAFNFSPLLSESDVVIAVQQ